MGILKKLGVLMVISAIVLRAECALTITGLSSVTIDKMGTFTAQTATVTETVTGDKKYTIMTQPTGDKFKIGETNGVLDSEPTAATFDTVTTYALVIKAEETGVPTNTGTVSITVTVMNMPPVFDPATYSKTFTGDQAAATLLTTVTATDPGVAPKAVITYTLMNKRERAMRQTTGNYANMKYF